MYYRIIIIVSSLDLSSLNATSLVSSLAIEINCFVILLSMFYDLNIKCRSNREVDRQLFLCRLLERKLLKFIVSWALIFPVTVGWDQVAWTTAVNKMGNQVKLNLILKLLSFT